MLVVQNFLEKHQATNYKQIVARMSLKMHFLHSHLEFFSDNNRYLSDEHGERFHLDVKLFEETTQNFWISVFITLFDLL